MKSILRRSLALASLALMAFMPAAQATNSATYHWGNTSGEVDLKVIDLVSTTWDSHLDTAIADWDASSRLALTEIAGSGSPATCTPVNGRAIVCNSTYGSTGWLGIAQIWTTTGSHISQASVKVNDTYFNTPTYNYPSWRQYILCHEMGKIMGLTDQDSSTANPNLGTCMDLTTSPLGPPSNEHPNTHDYDQTVLLYNHFDAANTTTGAPGGGASAAGGIDTTNPAEWGQMLAAEGNVSTFVRTFPDGSQLMTRVVWAEN